MRRGGDLKDKRGCRGVETKEKGGGKGPVIPGGNRRTKIETFRNKKNFHKIGCIYQKLGKGRKEVKGGRRGGGGRQLKE